MQCKFVSKSDGNSRLIVIFAGWSTDTTFYSHVVIPGWDTLVVSGYSDLKFPSVLLNGYSSIALFAWSLGVFAASQCFPFERACMAVAINGTERPVDDTYGIPENIYHGTTDTLNERNLLKFRRRMAGHTFKDIADKFPTIPITELQQQLNTIAKCHKQSTVEVSSHWDRAYVSLNDLIFPPQSQVNAWSKHPSKPHVIKVDAPHYVDLLLIIKAALPQHETIGKRFEKALPTYNDTAAPQKAIARHLMDMLSNNKHILNGKKIAKILEIGPGTGFLTHLFSTQFKPTSIDFVELYPQGYFGMAPTENHFVADAESWIAEKASSESDYYDAVISSSAIQWFANPKLFFKNATKLLRRGGVLLCSTFLPGNLEELLEVNPFGLVYRSAEALSNSMPESLSIISIQGEEIPAIFDNPRETLAHLIKTGVGGSAKSTLPIGDLLRKLPTTLTYRPLYLLAIKK